MKIKIFKVFTKLSLLSAIVLATAFTSAQAQSLGNRVKANIPFDFSIGDKKLPSGKYSIGRARLNSDDLVLSIEDGNGHSKAIHISIPAMTGTPKNQARVVFHRYGDQYFLYQVWPAGALTGRQFPKSRSEREIQRNLAANPSVGSMNGNVRLETVTIAGMLQ